MNPWLIGYGFCALVMFAWLAFPPFKPEQESQEKAFEYVLERHGRSWRAYLWLWTIVVMCSIGWPVAIVVSLFDMATDAEWYE